MTDLQNPIQDTNAQSTSNDMLGSISISVPSAPSDTAPATQTAAPVTTDAAADLTNISVPATAEPADISADIAAISIPTAPAEEATPIAEQPIVAAIEEVTLPTADTTTNTEQPMTNDVNTISVDLPVAAPAQEVIVTETTPVSPIPTTEEMPTETSVAPEEIPMPVSEPSLDLDALTNDVVVPTTTEEIPEPTTASVILPQATIMSTPINAAHSSKKKTVVMAALLLMLLAVGGFVFRTMMPDESDKLLANVMSLFGGSSLQQNIIPVVSTPIATGNTNTGAIEILSGSSDTTTGDDNEANLSGVVIITGDSITAVSGNANTAGTISDLLDDVAATGNTEVSYTSKYTLDQAKMTLSVMAEKSKKALVLAKKHNLENASEVLYRVFKDSSSLLETLENTRDISTIPNVDKQISDLQQNLSQATLILNVANTNNTQSE